MHLRKRVAFLIGCDSGDVTFTCQDGQFGSSSANNNCRFCIQAIAVVDVATVITVGAVVVVVLGTVLPTSYVLATVNFSFVVSLIQGFIFTWFCIAVA